MVIDLSHGNGPSLRRSIVALVTLVVVLLIGEHILASVTYNMLYGTGVFPVWFPHFRVVGTTLFAYNLFFDFLKFIAIPATLVWVGYVYGRYTTITAGSND